MQQTARTLLKLTVLVEVIWRNGRADLELDTSERSRGFAERPGWVFVATEWTLAHSPTTLSRGFSNACLIRSWLSASEMWI